MTSWVRWYAGVLEQSLSVSRVLGYYLNSSSNNNAKNRSLIEERKYLGVSNSDFLYKIESLVGFVEQVSRAPESLHLQRNDLVYEVVKLVGEDYRCVQSEIFLRVEELGNRMENLDVGELAELLNYFKRLENSKERLVLLFVNRKKNDVFWELVNETKKKAALMKEETEGRWLTVVKGRRDQFTESTRYTNPFLEPGQWVPVQPDDRWLGVNRFPLSVSTAR